MRPECVLGIFMTPSYLDVVYGPQHLGDGPTSASFHKSYWATALSTMGGPVTAPMEHFVSPSSGLHSHTWLEA